MSEQTNIPVGPIHIMRHNSTAGRCYIALHTHGELANTGSATPTTLAYADMSSVYAMMKSVSEGEALRQVIKFAKPYGGIETIRQQTYCKKTLFCRWFICKDKKHFITVSNMNSDKQMIFALFGSSKFNPLLNKNR